MQPVSVAVHAEMAVLRLMSGIFSAVRAHLDHLFLVVTPRPQTQILVFVEETLR